MCNFIALHHCTSLIMLQISSICLDVSHMSEKTINIWRSEERINIWKFNAPIMCWMLTNSVYVVTGRDYMQFHHSSSLHSLDNTSAFRHAPVCIPYLPKCYKRATKSRNDKHVKHLRTYHVPNADIFTVCSCGVQLHAILPYFLTPPLRLYFRIFGHLTVSQICPQGLYEYDEAK